MQAHVWQESSWKMQHQLSDCAAMMVDGGDGLPGLCSPRLCSPTTARGRSFKAPSALCKTTALDHSSDGSRSPNRRYDSNNSPAAGRDVARALAASLHAPALSPTSGSRVTRVPRRGGSVHRTVSDCQANLRALASAGGYHSGECVNGGSDGRPFLSPSGSGGMNARFVETEGTLDSCMEEEQERIVRRWLEPAEVEGDKTVTKVQKQKQGKQDSVQQKEAKQQGWQINPEQQQQLQQHDWQLQEHSPAAVATRQHGCPIQIPSIKPLLLQGSGANSSSISGSGNSSNCSSKRSSNSNGNVRSESLQADGWLAVHSASLPPGIGSSKVRSLDFDVREVTFKHEGEEVTAPLLFLRQPGGLRKLQGRTTRGCGGEGGAVKGREEAFGEREARTVVRSMDFDVQEVTFEHEGEVVTAPLLFMRRQQQQQQQDRHQPQGQINFHNQQQQQQAQQQGQMRGGYAAGGNQSFTGLSRFAPLSAASLNTHPHTRGEERSSSPTSHSTSQPTVPAASSPSGSHDGVPATGSPRVGWRQGRRAAEGAARSKDTSGLSSERRSSPGASASRSSRCATPAGSSLRRLDNGPSGAPGRTESAAAAAAALRSSCRVDSSGRGSGSGSASPASGDGTSCGGSSGDEGPSHLEPAMTLAWGHVSRAVKGSGAVVVPRLHANSARKTPQGYHHPHHPHCRPHHQERQHPHHHHQQHHAAGAAAAPADRQSGRVATIPELHSVVEFDLESVDTRAIKQLLEKSIANASASGAAASGKVVAGPRVGRRNRVAAAGVRMGGGGLRQMHDACDGTVTTPLSIALKKGLGLMEGSKKLVPGHQLSLKVAALCPHGMDPPGDSSSAADVAGAVRRGRKVGCDLTGSFQGASASSRALPFAGDSHCAATKSAAAAGAPVGGVVGSSRRRVRGRRATDFVLCEEYEDIHGSYALHREELGRGQYGVIRQCMSIKTGLVYACKTIGKESITVSCSA